MKDILDFFKNTWKFVSNLPSETKTIIIFVLLGFALHPLYKEYYENTIIECIGKAFHN